MLFNIVAPVVVKPETVSKKASIKDGMLPENKNGKEPKNEKKIQPNVTINKASFALILLVLTEILDIGKPITSNNKIEYIKADRSFPPVNKDTNKGGKRAIASNRSRLPNTFITIQ